MRVEVQGTEGGAVFEGSRITEWQPSGDQDPLTPAELERLPPPWPDEPFGAVAREWTGGRSGLVAPFRAAFREHLGRRLALVVPWSALGLVLALNASLIAEMPLAMRLPLLALTSTACVLYAATTVYLFAVLVSYDAGVWTVVRPAFGFALARPAATLACLGCWLAAVLACLVMPVLVLVAGSLTAYATTWVYGRGLGQVLALRGRA